MTRPTLTYGFRELAAKIRGKRVLVVGDYIEDVYVHVQPVKLSAEAPIPVFVQVGSDTHPGGACNAAANIASLGGIPWLVTGSERSVKTRYVAGDSQVFRFDEDVDSSISEMDLLGRYDAVLVSDYGKGAITRDVMRFVCSLGVPVVVDPKPGRTPVEVYKGAHVATPNHAEYNSVSSWPCPCIITLGSAGAVLAGNPETHVDAWPVNVVDVTGAGDSFAAAVALGFAAKMPIRNCLFFANIVGACKVRKFGCYAVSIDEVSAFFDEDQP